MIDWTLVDTGSLALVSGGTLLATFVRAGWQDTRVTLVQLAQLARRPFDLRGAKAELARTVYRMQYDGVVRTDAPQLEDHEISDATKALIRDRSVDAIISEHERHRALRQRAKNRSVRTLEIAAELAPVLGMVGTLFSLASLRSANFEDSEAMIGAVSMAVTSTLYGLLLATFFFFPLAKAVDRRFEREARRRDELTDWLVEELRVACPNPSHTTFSSIA